MLRYWRVEAQQNTLSQEVHQMTKLHCSADLFLKSQWHEWLHMLGWTIITRDLLLFFYFSLFVQALRGSNRRLTAASSARSRQNPGGPLGSPARGRSRSRPESRRAASSRMTAAAPQLPRQLPAEPSCSARRVYLQPPAKSRIRLPVPGRPWRGGRPPAHRRRGARPPPRGGGTQPPRQRGALPHR